MDDRSTLERAFDHVNCAHEASNGLIRLSAPDREVAVAIDRAKRMLGQMLAEETAATPWTRWKAATCDLVNWAAARIMRALYIAPFRVCLQNVHASSHHIETASPVPSSARTERPLWLSAREIAGMRLPGLPASARGVRKRAMAHNWPSKPRPGKGGGLLYSTSSFPDSARAELASRGGVK